MSADKPAPESGPPTSLARRFVRYVLGFGVGVGAAVLVFLTTGLFQVIPDAVRDVALPTSSLLMGLVAVGVQFYARESIRRRTLRHLFTAGVAILVIGVVLFLSLYVLDVQTVNGGDRTFVVVLPGSRLPGCPCSAETSDEDCVLRLGFDGATPRTDTCWDRFRIRRVRAELLLTYLLITIGFGVLVGMVVVQEELRRAARRRRKKT